MSVREANVEKTRQRIVEAAKSLHADQGILGTNYEAIAQRAGVSQATVYRHFPTLDDLIPACARSIHVLQPATPQLVESIFYGLSDPLERLERLIRGTCACYERDGAWLHAAHREGDLIPSVHAIIHQQRETLRTLVRAALEGVASERMERVVVALIDIPFWRSLRDAGLSAEEAVNLIVELAGDQLAKEGVAARWRGRQ
jgi:AcrR family transcriptional regulator